MSADSGPEVHDMIKPLSWLLGKWKGDGVGKYPTIKDFTYTEELTFSHVGQPNIQFSFFSRNSKTMKPMHHELGFIRFKPGTSHCALLIAHNFGVSEVEEGEFTDTEIRTESHTVGRLSFGKPPETKKIKRVFSKTGDDSLEQVVFMETANSPMTEHLRVTYKKVTL